MMSCKMAVIHVILMVWAQMMTNQVKMVIYHLLTIKDVKRQHRHGIISYHL